MEMRVVHIQEVGAESFVALRPSKANPKECLATGVQDISSQEGWSLGILASKWSGLVAFIKACSNTTSVHC